MGRAGFKLNVTRTPGVYQAVCPHIATAPDPTGSESEFLVQYERQLSPGIIGSLWLGRLATGNEAGRLVTIRRIPLALLDAEDVERVHLSAGAFARLRSPSIVKLLGVAELDGELISVSEYLAGIRLIDLQRCLIESAATIPVSVALRLILDLVQASILARRVIMNLGVPAPRRIVLSDSALVALSGEVLLTDVGIVPSLLRNPNIASLPEVAVELAPEEHDSQMMLPGSPEGYTFGVSLWQLLTNHWIDSRRSSAQDTVDNSQAREIPRVDSVVRPGMAVPDSVVQLVQKATERDAKRRFPSLEAMADALAQLPAQLIATTHQLQATVQQLAPQILPEFNASATWSIPARPDMSLPPSHPVSLHPPGAHNWEPPTFAERRLVAPVLTTTTRQSVDPSRVLLSLRPHSLRPPVVRYMGPTRSARPWLWVAGIAIALALAALTLAIRHPKQVVIGVTAERASASAVQRQPAGETRLPPAVTMASTTSTDNPMEPRTVETTAAKQKDAPREPTSAERLAPSVNEPAPGGGYRSHKISTLPPTGHLSAPHLDVESAHETHGN